MTGFWTSIRNCFQMFVCNPDTLRPSRRRLVLGCTIGVLILGALCLGTLSLIFGSLYFVRVRLLSYFQIPFLAFLNLFPVVLLALLLYFLTNRAWIAFGLSSLLVLTGSFVNYYKVVFRDDPLVAEDLGQIRDAAGIMGQYDFHFTYHFYCAIGLCVLGTLILAFFFRGRVKKVRWRLLGCAVLVLISLGSYRLWYESDDLYDSFENYTYFNRYKPTEDSASRGFVYPFLHSITECFLPAPEGYSTEAAQQMLNAYTEDSIPEGQKVNFICVMLESFADLSVCADIPFQKDPYEDFHKLQAESYSGLLLSDTMGGGTCNAERSFLTGYAYPHVNYRHPTESFVWYFRRQGYYTEGCHPGHNWFYNRQNIDENLGFEAYQFSEELFSQLTEEEYAYDDIFFPALRDQYDNRPSDQPYFNFSVSYQGHSPYDTESLQWGEEYIAQDDLPLESYYLLNNYFGSIADTSRRMSEFVDSFRDEEEPVVLVFFGDHKPTLGAGNNFYASLGIDLDRSTLEGFTNYYATPYLIWANDAAKEALNCDVTGQGANISPMYLMPELFDLLGWKGPAYMQLLLDLKPVLPLVHSTQVYLENGVLTETLSPNSQKLLENLEIIQYYLRDAVYS